MASVLFYCEPEEVELDGNDYNFLEACSMCEKRLDLNDDVFMYRGISAFCSDDCRQRQIEIDCPPQRRPTYKPSASDRQRWRPSSGAAANGPVLTGLLRPPNSLFIS